MKISEEISLELSKLSEKLVKIFKAIMYLNLKNTKYTFLGNEKTNKQEVEEGRTQTSPTVLFLVNNEKKEKK